MKSSSLVTCGSEKDQIKEADMYLSFHLIVMSACMVKITYINVSDQVFIEYFLCTTYSLMV